MIIGNKEIFAFDIGDQRYESKLRSIDVVISNRYVCCDDNTAFLPQFIRSLNFDVNRIIENDFNQYKPCFETKNADEIHQFILGARTEGATEYDIEGDKIYSCYNFLDWGPTTDNLYCFIVPANGLYYLTYQFWRPEHSIKSEVGEIQSVRIELEEIVKIIEETISVLNG